MLQIVSAAAPWVSPFLSAVDFFPFHSGNLGPVLPLQPASARCPFSFKRTRTDSAGHLFFFMLQKHRHLKELSV